MNVGPEFKCISFVFHDFQPPTSLNFPGPRKFSGPNAEADKKGEQKANRGPPHVMAVAVLRAPL